MYIHKEQTQMEVTNTNLLSRKRLCRSFVLTGVEVIAADVSRFKNYKNNFHNHVF